MLATRSGRQGGMATIWACASIGLLLTLGCVAFSAAAAVATQHHLDGAADLAALSAASRLQHGGDACGVATSVANRNRARLASCQLRGQDVVVRVTAPLRLPFGLHLTLVSEARAGPA